MSPPVVATVGTTHPLGFAGLTFATLALATDGVRPVCVVAGVTAQDASHVSARTPLDAATITAQFDALRDAGVAAFHIGALLSGDAVRAVARGVARFPGIPVVVDPVLAATGGDALADGGARDALRDELVPLASLVTPNLDEAAALLGYPVADVDAMGDAARACLALGARAALVKGGHLAGDAVDVLAEGAQLHTFAAARVAGTLRGTGDLLAATIASSLANGYDLHAAIERARTRVRGAITRGVPFAGTRVARADAP